MPISTHSQGSAKNRLLAALPGEVFDRLLPHLHPVSFVPRHVVYESNEQMEDLYFPTTCVVSLLYTMTDDATAEIGLVGNDGVVGIALFMGGSTRPNRAVVQVAGDAFSVPAPVIQEEFKLGGPCQILLLRYTQALITKISQTAVCNRLHSPEQRFCRWLLRIHDRVESAELRITHEFIAKMQGGDVARVSPGCGTPAGSRADPLRPRPDHDPRPSGPGSSQLRVLSSRQKRIRSLAEQWPVRGPLSLPLRRSHLIRDAPEVDGDRGVNESWPSSKKKALFFVRLLNKSLLQVPDDSSISAR